MFRVYCDDVLIYDPRVASLESNLEMMEPTLALSVGSSGSFRFALQSNHDYIDRIHRMRSIIDVYDDDVLLFRGRVVRDSVNWLGKHVIEVEGIGSALNDSIMRPFDFPTEYLTDESYQQAVASGNVVQFLLEKILEIHNRQVSDRQKVYLGNVTVTDPNNYIARSSENPATVWDTLTEKFISSSLGGYFVFRYDSGVTYLDYVKEFDTWNTQEIQFAENLLDFTSEVYGGEMYNAIYAVGRDGLTVDAMADGTYSGMVKDGSVIYDPERVALYGRITKVIEWGDVTYAENLLNKAVTNLQDLAGAMPQSLTVSALDLSSIDGSINAFRIGKLCHVVSKPHGYEDDYPLMELSINLLDASQTKLTLSKETETYTGELERRKADVNNIVNDIKGTARETRDELINRLVIAESQVTQSADNITALLSRIDDLNRQLTEVKATADGLAIQVTNIQTIGVDSVRTSTGYTFGADGLIVSKAGEEMENKLDNTGLYVSRSGEPILTANNEGVDAINLHARNYLIIGSNDRFEDYSTASDPHRTGAFYIGPDW